MTPLTINKASFKMEKNAKFLRVIFDSALTFGDHVKYVEDKCKKRLNLMRMTSGSSWGANKQMLLTMYRTLIRPLLVYGAIALDSTAAVPKDKMDVIQAKALSIACEAMSTTSIAALLIETNVKPQQLVRKQLEIKCALK